MFLKNTTDRDIKLRSFDGFSFVVSPGVFWVHDPAGSELLKMYGTQDGVNGTYKYEGGQRVFVPSNVVPPIIQANEKQWINGGKRLAVVERFKVIYTQIPKREQLIGIAQKRGVAKERIQEFLADESIDRSEIADAINKLPVPENVEYPSNLEDDTKTNDTDKDNS